MDGLAKFLKAVLPWVRTIMVILTALSGGAVAQTVSQGGFGAVEPSTGLASTLIPLILAGISQGGLVWARNYVTKATGSATAGSLFEIDSLVAANSAAKDNPKAKAALAVLAHQWVDAEFGPTPILPSPVNPVVPANVIPSN